VTTLVDTSALYALLDEDDAHHEDAVRVWVDLLQTDRLITHNYAVLEASALVQRRLGSDAAERLHRRLLPVVELIVIDGSTHARAVERWLTERRRQLSLVDVTSFLVMRDAGLQRAFAYDDDFVGEGFTTGH
jgi:predicted nucleic acid-binding protein